MDVITNEAFLEKAAFTTADLGGSVSEGGADRFINLMTEEQEVLGDVRVVRNVEANWEEPFLDFAARIMRPGTEAQRVADADRVKPTTGTVAISTKLTKGEVLMSREALEDALGGQNNFQNSLEEGIAARAGYDIEELLINGDTAVAGTDPYLGLLDGWLKQARGAGGNIVSAAGHTTASQTFAALLGALPNRWKRRLRQDGRFWVPYSVEERYRAELAQRGTAYGDESERDNMALRYRGIPIIPVANWPVMAGSPDTSYVLLSNRQNLYAGFRREIEIDTDYSKREGNLAFLISARVDARLGVRDATAIATGVNAEPAA